MNEKLDLILSDIVEIFNMEKVELVRLSGLTLTEKKIDFNISGEFWNKIIAQLKKRNAINYNKIVYCPHCKEIFYLKKEIKDTKICDTCKNIFSINSFNIINENQVDNIINLNTLISYYQIYIYHNKGFY